MKREHRKILPRFSRDCDTLGGKKAGLRKGAFSGRIRKERKEITMNRKKKEAAPRVLVTAFASSDPVRGCHDGAYLHILRFYRPEVIYVLLTAEFAEDNRKDHRLEKTMEFVKTHWEGYSPEVHCFGEEITNPSDLDTLDEPFKKVFSEIQEKYPDSEILLNLSSGTPQIKMLLTLYSIDTRYYACGVQVSNFENRAGTTERTNSKDYAVDEALELNEDEEAFAEGACHSRCTEPELLAVQKSMQTERILALLRQRDYSAIAAMKEDLPPEIGLLAEHLAAREQLQDKKARELADELQNRYGTDIVFYPIKTEKVQEHFGDSYSTVSEYFLTLKNLAYTGRYTDFTVRLNPLIIQLQIALLEIYLEKDWRLKLQDILTTDENGILNYSVEKIAYNCPKLKQQLDKLMKDDTGRPALNGKLSILLLNHLLSCCSSMPQKDMDLLKDIETLNKEERNSVAHSLRTVTAEDIQSVYKRTPVELIRDLKQLIISIYPECDPAIFDIYEVCNAYIRAHL